MTIMVAREEGGAQVFALEPGGTEPQRISLGGVCLCLDWQRQEYYVDVSVFHSRKAVRALLATLDALGLELMDEDECPTETVVGPTGLRHLRSWICERTDRMTEALIWPDWT